jgi:2-keto-3-deoxy-L-rhamnonate aldolase RhmA
MHAVQARPCASLLRVAANDPVEIKRAVDIGIAGIMVPVVDSRADAEAAVSACRYPPAGRRGVAPIIVRAADYGADWRDYVDRANDELLIICQIESRQAVENAAEIVSVEGVDMIFLGPFDLSANLGYMGEPDHPETRAAVEAVEAAVKAAGKLLGGLPTPERSAEELYEAGYNLVLADFDAALLRDGARARVAALRAASRTGS